MRVFFVSLDYWFLHDSFISFYIMHKEWYIYSLDPGLNLKDLRLWKYEPLEYDTEKLSFRMKKRWITSWVVGKDAHFKFDAIVTKPFVIYTQWNVSLLDRSLLAIVGPRKSSWYQEQVLKDSFKEFSKHHVVTISWWALGIDTLCHELSLEYWIPTIIVLGAWFQHYLTSKYRYLLEKVVNAWGLIISEFRLWEQPSNWTYPQRNRIIAGLAEVVFLPWAGKKSGSLITVDFALKMHKRVVTVPASIYENSSDGTNAYIQAWKIQGIVNIEDILWESFAIKQRPWSDVRIELNKDEESIMKYVTHNGASWISQICVACKIDLWDIFVILMELQLKWLLDEDANGNRSAR